MKKNLNTLLLAVVALAPGFALAAPVDVAPAVDQLSTDGTTAITAIGGAVIALAALAVVFKWVKGAIFG